MRASACVVSRPQMSISNQTWLSRRFASRWRRPLRKHPFGAKPALARRRWGLVGAKQAESDGGGASSAPHVVVAHRGGDVRVHVDQLAPGGDQRDYHDQCPPSQDEGVLPHPPALLGPAEKMKH